MLNMIEYASIYLKKQDVEYARIIFNASDAVHNIRSLPTLKPCVHFKMYTTDVYKMYTRCIYTKYIPHFDNLLYTFCIQN